MPFPFRTIAASLPFVLAALVTAQGRSNPASATANQNAPCDLYAAAHTPCVAAHSTTRALYDTYNGPLYQVKRTSDGKTLNIGLLHTPSSNAPGYANAAAQDAFCARTLCLINVVYDQSGNKNHLTQAGPGTFKGPAKGAYDTQPIADMAPITIAGHKAYGVFIIPGMGLRNNDASHLAIDDEPEGIYYVVDGTHFDSGCCFDYGNSSTNGRAVGTGTMETTYFGTSTVWGRGVGPGPWIMSDMEAGLFSGKGAKDNPGDPTIDSWRFVTAVVDGGSNDHWDLRGGNAQRGGLTTFYDGVRPAPNRSGVYNPMRRQGGILLGTGGDNGNGSSGTFYEGVMTSGYPDHATTDAVQANIVAARYDVQRLRLSRITTFTPGSTQQVTATFTNTTGAPLDGLRLSLALPNERWISVVSGTGNSVKSFPGAIKEGSSVSAVFSVTSSASTGADFLSAKAAWTNSKVHKSESDTTTLPLRNVLPVKINEVSFGSTTGSTGQFLELYNPTEKTIDVSRWSVTHTISGSASLQVAAIPQNTSVAPHGFYLLRLAGAGLAAPATPGDRDLNLTSTAGYAIGQTIEVEGETATFTRLGTPAAAATTIFSSVSTGPRINLPAGATNIPVASSAGFVVGEKIGIDAGGHYEVRTVRGVGKQATLTVLSSAAVSGSTHLQVAAVNDLSVGDTLTISTGQRKETAIVARVGAAAANGSGVDLAAPLRLAHAAGVDVSDIGTGVTFAPATRFAHSSGDALQALGSGITLDHPVRRAHAYGSPVLTKEAASQGSPKAQQYFGIAFSETAGSLALTDAAGAVVDAIVYGSRQSNSSANGIITSPELAILEGDQGQGGCIVTAPFRVGFPGTSIGRFPDGADTDSNCTDFVSQSAASLALATQAGAENVKVTSVTGFSPGQTVVIDSGASEETATLEAVGSAGGTSLTADVSPGAQVLSVGSILGFRPGQSITIDTDAKAETVTIASLTGRGKPTLTLTAPLASSHAVDTPVSGRGLGLRGKLTKPHAANAPVMTDAPTPGAPNIYRQPLAENDKRL